MVKRKGGEDRRGRGWKGERMEGGEDGRGRRERGREGGGVRIDDKVEE